MDTRQALLSVNKWYLAKLLNETTGSSISAYRATTESLVARIEAKFSICQPENFSDAEEMLAKTPGAIGVQIWLDGNLISKNQMGIVPEFEVGSRIVRLILVRR